ncbi:uncharacterized protein Ecym_6440 [Eremothecium cymbalariae DBVPG|uniref:Uncharacterized protein n=1 Tax=Eremothecium cymbalariae (strain CBS 270.75 / DBVPG 7215 / KCTC 17166 / NRRL Y-17582) TaxID=931890 RepID=G8JUN1_ERECY|nr:hypothetical protein Ecym_6440 [Eremothecium cymbalariae DBVPG\
MSKDSNGCKRNNSKGKHLGNRNKLKSENGGDRNGPSAATGKNGKTQNNKVDKKMNSGDSHDVSSNNSSCNSSGYNNHGSANASNIGNIAGANNANANASNGAGPNSISGNIKEGSIAWREVNYGNPEFVFKEPKNGPKPVMVSRGVQTSNITQVQLRHLFGDSASAHRGNSVYASLVSISSSSSVASSSSSLPPLPQLSSATPQQVQLDDCAVVTGDEDENPQTETIRQRQDSCCSPLSSQNKDTTLSSFTSFSSIDNGYQIRYQLKRNEDACAKTGQRPTNKANLELKLSRLVRACRRYSDDRNDNSTTLTHLGWQAIPLCCSQALKLSEPVIINDQQSTCGTGLSADTSEGL